MHTGIAFLAGVVAIGGLLLAAAPAAAKDRGWGRGHHHQHHYHRHPGHWVHPQFGPSYWAPAPRYRPPPAYYPPPAYHHPGYPRPYHGPRGGFSLGVQIPVW